MFKKLFITSILLALMTGVLFSSSELFMKKKIQIEDGFRGMGLDPDLYKIWIGTRDDANMNSQYKIQKKNTKGSQKQYIPGLPTIPSAPRKVSTPSSSYNESYIVYIYIDNSYNTDELKNSMGTMIKTNIWPALNHCDDCVQFKALAFYKRNTKEGLSSNSGLAVAEDAARALEAKLIELQDANIALERTNELSTYALAEQEKAILEQQFADYEEQLKLLQNQNEEKEGTLEKTNSFRMAYLEEQYKMHLNFKDSLLIRYGQKLDNVYDPLEGCMNEKALNYSPKANKQCKDCCRYDANSPFYMVGCMDASATNYDNAATQPCPNGCCDYAPSAVEGCMDDRATNYNARATIDGECEYAESNAMIFILIGLISILIILAIIMVVGNKKKVVYLKPKDNKNKKQNDNEDNTDSGQLQNTQPPLVPPTSASIDEGVLQSEIQTKRQSAVAMSAGQKEGATQILKDWLNESKNEEENSEE